MTVTAIAQPAMVSVVSIVKSLPESSAEEVKNEEAEKEEDEEERGGEVAGKVTGVLVVDPAAAVKTVVCDVDDEVADEDRGGDVDEVDDDEERPIAEEDDDEGQSPSRIQ